MTHLWTYEVRVQGQIGERWAHWFDEMSVVSTGGPDSAVTTLRGNVVDQAALLGLLQRLYTLGLPLLLVRRLSSSESGEDSQCK